MTKFVPPVVGCVKDLAEEPAVVVGLVELSLGFEEPAGGVEGLKNLGVIVYEVVEVVVRGRVGAERGRIVAIRGRG